MWWVMIWEEIAEKYSKSFSAKVIQFLHYSAQQMWLLLFCSSPKVPNEFREVIMVETYLSVN